MAVALQQAVATAASGASTVSNLTVTLGAIPTNTTILVVALDNGAALNRPLTSVGELISTPIFAGNLSIYAHRVNISTAGMSITFNTACHAAAYLIEFTAGVNSIIVTPVTGTAPGALPASGSTPPQWAPLIGDLPLGFFAALNRGTITPQGGWTELANLNNTAGFFAQFELQQGPSATANNQPTTAQATWAGNSQNIAGALVIASTSSPLALMSQEATEVVAQDTASAHISQDVVEAVVIDTASMRLSQHAFEAITADTAFGRISQVVVEAIIQLFVRVSQDVAEVLGLDTAKARVSQNVVEVLFSSQNARRRVVDDEWFTF